MKIISEVIKNFISSLFLITRRLLEILLIFSILFIFLFHSYWFQTFIGTVFTNYYSTELQTQVSIKQIKLKGIKYVELYDVYISDMEGDTLLYAPKIKASLKDFSLKNKFAIIETIRSENARIKIQKYKGNNKTNLQFLIDYFRKPKTQKVFTFKIEELELGGAHLSYNDWNRSKKPYVIDYHHVDLKDFNGSILEFRNRSGVTSVDLKDISFTEQSGFKLYDLDTHLLFNPKKIKIEGLNLRTKESDIRSKGIVFNYHDKGDLKDFVYAVIMDASVQPSKINLHDLSYFVHRLKNINRTIDFSGLVSGPVNNLFVEDLSLGLSPLSFFKGNVEFKGLTDFQYCLISMKIERCQTTIEDFEDIDMTKFGLDNNITLPDHLAEFGEISLKGNIEGFYDDFLAQFDITSYKGVAHGDFDFKLDENNTLYYKGTLDTKDLDFGVLTNNKSLGTFNSSIQVDGKGLSLNEMDISVIGTFDNFFYNNYYYDKINVHGKFKEKAFEGELLISDHNVDMTFEGDFNLAESPVLFDFKMNVKQANLYDLHLVDERESSSICFNMMASGFGNNLDDFSGMIEVRNIGYFENGKDYYFDSIFFDSQSNQYRHNIELYSKFVEFKMAGQYSLDTLVDNLYELGSKVVPSLIPPEKIHKCFHEDFLLDVKVNDLSKLTELFQPDLGVSPNTELNCSFNSDYDLLELYVSSEWIKYKGLRFANIELDTTKKLIDIDTSYMLSLFIDSVFISPELCVQNVNISSRAYADKFDLDLSWAADDSAYWGIVYSNGELLSNSSFNIDITSSEIFSKEAGQWLMEDNFSLLVDTSTIEIIDLIAKNHRQSIIVNGKISEDPNEKLNFKLDSILLGDLNDFFPMTEVKFNGIIDIEGNVSDIYNNIYLNADASVTDIAINNYKLGEFSATTKWNPFFKRLELDGKLKNEKDRVEFTLDKCYYYPDNDNDQLDFNLHFDNMDIDFTNVFLKEEVVSDLTGLVTGDLDIKGTPTECKFDGFLDLNNGSLNLDMFHTTYKTNGRIHLNPEEIYVEQIPIIDKYGAKGELTGYFYHKNFSKYSLDMVSTFDEPFLVMNTDYKMNPLYYGDAYLTGLVTVSYNKIYNFEINVDARTEKGTDITLPLYGSEEIVLQDFISFNSDNVLVEDYETDLEGVNLNLSMDITEDAEIQLVFDEIVGDAMKGKGSGHIDMFIDQFHEFSMYGQYNISQGSYLFTLKDFINKKFRVKPGGTISWYGDPYKADLDLVAIYPLKISLYNIMPESEREDYKNKTDVNVEMKLSNNLFNPDIAFDILLPDAKVKAKSDFGMAKLSLVSSEQEMNRQVFSLLILNKFITQKQPLPVSDLSFIGSTTSEVLSNQLSNMISKFSDEFDIGFNYRPGDDISNKEVTVAMSTQQFNDRLSIKTNLGVSQGNSNGNNNSFIGDVDVEYKLNTEGNFRIHAFNESNDYDITNIDQSQGYTQGIGAFYQQSFDNLGELFCEIGNLLKRKNKECKQCEDKNGRKECRDKL